MKKFLKDAAVYAGIGLVGFVGMKKGNDMQAKIDADTKAKTAQVLTETPRSTDHIYDLSQHHEQQAGEQEGVDEKIEGDNDDSLTELQASHPELFAQAELLTANPEFQQGMDTIQEHSKEIGEILKRAKEGEHPKVLAASLNFLGMSDWLFGVLMVLACVGTYSMHTRAKKAKDADGAEEWKEYFQLSGLGLGAGLVAKIIEWNVESVHDLSNSHLRLGALGAGLIATLVKGEILGHTLDKNEKKLTKIALFVLILLGGMTNNKNISELPIFQDKPLTKEQKQDSIKTYKIELQKKQDETPPTETNSPVVEETNSPASTTQTETKPEPEAKPEPKPAPKPTPPKKATPAPKEDDITVIPAGKNTGATGTTPKSN